MNFFDNIPNFNGPIQEINNPMMNPNINNHMMNNNINYKINELEQKIKRLEQRIILLETDKGNNNYTEPDNSLYMI